MSKEELWTIRENNSQKLFSLGNWVSILEIVIPDDTAVGGKIKVGKKDIILSISNIIGKLRENNNKLQRLIDETYGKE